jgi:hypothetical protein
MQRLLSSVENYFPRENGSRSIGACFPKMARHRRHLTVSSNSWRYEILTYIYPFQKIPTDGLWWSCLPVHTNNRWLVMNTQRPTLTSEDTIQTRYCTCACSYFDECVAEMICFDCYACTKSWIGKPQVARFMSLRFCRLNPLLFPAGSAAR